jgi:YD repeat-containing protein
VTKIMLALLTLAMSTDALAESRSFYDSSGRRIGSATTDSQGSTTFYDSRGRVTGKSSTDSQGTSTFYDASGHAVGRATSPQRREGR